MIGSNSDIDWLSRNSMGGITADIARNSDLDVRYCLRCWRRVVVSNRDVE